MTIDGQHRPEDHVEPNSVVHYSKESEPTQDQQAADSFPFPGGDETGHHCQHGDKEQVHGERLERRVGRHGLIFGLPAFGPQYYELPSSDFLLRRFLLARCMPCFFV